MPKPSARAGARPVDDRELAALLADMTLLEIRGLARRANRSPGEAALADILERINGLADFCHGMRAVAASRPRRPSRGGPPSRRAQAMRERPMSYRWAVASAERRAWILRFVEDAGYRWTPPPPLPTPRKGVPPLTARQRLRVLAGWPVKTPPGLRPLPRGARILKALDRDGMFALHQEAGRERLGLGEASPWLYAHLDPDAAHYLFPDPASYYWPDPGAGRPWWQCTVLLRMTDGERVSGLLAVLPGTFTALPSTVPRREQRRLALTARLTERDSYLWSRDHAPLCSPEDCGYPPDRPPDTRES